MPRIDEVLSRLSNMVEVMGGAAAIASFAQSAMGKGGPESVPPDDKKGWGGIYGDVDEELWGALMVAFQKEAPEDFRLFQKFLAWDRKRAKKLEKKLSEPLAVWFRIYYRNRMRHIITCMPKVSAEKLSTSTYERITNVQPQKGHPQSRKRTVKVTKDNMSPGRSNALEFLKLLTKTINAELMELQSKRSSLGETARENRAFKKGLEFLDAQGIPRIPDPDSIPDIMGWLDWLQGEGRGIFAEIERLVYVYVDHVDNIKANEGWLMRRMRRFVEALG